MTLPRKLQALLDRNQGRDVLAFRQGPFALYFWNPEKGEHEQFDPLFRPPRVDRRPFMRSREEGGFDSKGYKLALDERSRWLNRRQRAVRDSF